MIKINKASEKVGSAFKEFNHLIEEGRRQFGNNELVNKFQDSASLLCQSFVTVQDSEKAEDRLHTFTKDDMDAFFTNPATESVINALVQSCLDKKKKNIIDSSMSSFNLLTPSPFVTQPDDVDKSVDVQMGISSADVPHCIRNLNEDVPDCSVHEGQVIEKDIITDSEE